TAGPARPSGASAMKLSKLLLLIGAKDLAQLGIDLFLKRIELLLLLVGQFERVLHETRQYLPAAWRAAKTAAGTAGSARTAESSRATRRGPEPALSSRSAALESGSLSG